MARLPRRESWRLLFSDTRRAKKEQREYRLLVERVEEPEAARSGFEGAFEFDLAYELAFEGGEDLFEFEFVEGYECSLYSFVLLGVLIDLDVAFYNVVEHGSQLVCSFVHGFIVSDEEGAKG